MDKRGWKLKRALRLDRPQKMPLDLLQVFDLELLDRSFRESLHVAKLRGRRAKYLRGPSGAGR